MDMLARPRDPSMVIPVSAIRPFLLAFDELEDEESKECEAVRDFRAGAAASLFGSNRTADAKEEERFSAVLLPRWESAALSRLTVRDKEGISVYSYHADMCCQARSPKNQRLSIKQGGGGPLVIRFPPLGAGPAQAIISNRNLYVHVF